MSDNLIVDFDELGKPVGVTLEHYSQISDSSTIGSTAADHPRPSAGLRKGGRSPQASEGQQSFQLGIQGWLGLLSLPLDQQIIQKPSEANQPPAPAFFAEPIEQAIAAGGEVQPAGGMEVNGGRSRSKKPDLAMADLSAGPGLQAGRGSRTRAAGMAPRSSTPPRTLSRPARQPSKASVHQAAAALPAGNDPFHCSSHSPASSDPSPATAPTAPPGCSGESR